MFRLGWVGLLVDITFSQAEIFVKLQSRIRTRFVSGRANPGATVDPENGLRRSEALPGDAGPVPGGHRRGREEGE